MAGLLSTSRTSSRAKPLPNARQWTRTATRAHRSGHRGDVPVYTFYDRRITAGPEQGRDEGAARSYVYRLRGDEFDEVWGLLPGQEQRELVVRRWRRAGQAR